MFESTTNSIKTTRNAKMRFHDLFSTSSGLCKTRGFVQKGKSIKIYQKNQGLQQVVQGFEIFN